MPLASTLHIILSGNEQVVTTGTTAGEAFETTDRSIVAARVNGELRDLDWQLSDGDVVEPVLIDSADGLAIVRHSAAHVMAQAVQELHPGTKLGIGPPVKDGFFYDFDVAGSFTPDDLKVIEKRMQHIIKQGQVFRRRPVSEDEARAEMDQEPYKLELIGLKGDAANATEGASAEVGGEGLTIYDNVNAKSGDLLWKDLCRGPHVPSTRYIPAVKLLRSAAAYWRGSEENPQLQRIYGTAWDSRDALKKYLHFLEEAARRDHRRLGRELELFHLDKTAPGMPYWLPRGLKLLNTLLDFWRHDHEQRGYQEISTPLINDSSLWRVSGHWDHYKDDMFVIPLNENTTYGVKPMNCPNAMVVFNYKSRSYRDLPLRFSDCDTLHRNERSGTLHGLLRVRRITQDDAHIFIAPSQIREEYERIFDICDRYYSIFRLGYTLRLGTRPEGFIGDAETWDRAESELRDILTERMGDNGYIVEEGGGAFYGPKIDIVMHDALGREWQMGTIQLDFQLPRRFECQYTDTDGQLKTPVVVHRVIYGSLERFIGILIEHTAGAFPLWISPVQVRVIPVHRDHEGYAEEVATQLLARGIRVETSREDASLASKIKRGQLEKTPIMLILGDREAKQKLVTARLRTGDNLPAMSVDAFGDLIQHVAEQKEFDLNSLAQTAAATKTV